MKESLTYLRVAHKNKDGYDGLLYLHAWATGYQYLVLSSKESAERMRATFTAGA